MRILVVNWQDRENPQAGGAETHLHEIFGRLSRLGHEVTLLCGGWPGSPPRATLDGIHVHRTGSLGAYLFSQRGEGSVQGGFVVVAELRNVFVHE